MKVSWESFWIELFPSNSAGIESHHRQRSAGLASIFKHNKSRKDHSLPQLEKVNYGTGKMCIKFS